MSNKSNPKNLNNSITKPPVVTTKPVPPGKNNRSVTVPPPNNRNGLGGNNQLGPNNNGPTPKPSRSTTPRMKDPKEGKVSQYSIHFTKRRQFVQEQQRQREVDLAKAKNQHYGQDSDDDNSNHSGGHKAKYGILHQSDSDDDDRFYSKKKSAQNKTPLSTPGGSPAKGPPTNNGQLQRRDSFVQTEPVSILDNKDHHALKKYGSQTSVRSNHSQHGQHKHIKGKDSTTDDDTDSDDGYPPRKNKNKPSVQKQNGSAYQRHDSPRYRDGWGFGTARTKPDHGNQRGNHRQDSNSDTDSRGNSPVLSSAERHKRRLNYQSTLDKINHHGGSRPQSRHSQNGVHPHDHPTKPNPENNGSKNPYAKSPVGSRPQTPPHGKYNGGYDHNPNSKGPAGTRPQTPPHGKYNGGYDHNPNSKSPAGTRPQTPPHGKYNGGYDHNPNSKSPAGTRPQTPPHGKYNGGYDHGPNSKGPGLSRSNTPPHGVKTGPHSRAQSPLNKNNPGHPYAKNGSKYGNETPDSTPNSPINGRKTPNGKPWKATPPHSPYNDRKSPYGKDDAATHPRGYQPSPPHSPYNGQKNPYSKDGSTTPTYGNQQNNLYNGAAKTVPNIMAAANNISKQNYHY